MEEVVDLALGLSRNPNDDFDFILKSFEIKANRQWKAKMTSKPGFTKGRRVVSYRNNGFYRANLAHGPETVNDPYEAFINMAMNNAVDRGGRLKFITRGMDISRVTDDLSAVFSRGPLKDSANVTNWELARILTDRKLYNSTDFFDSSNRFIPPDQLADYGLGFLGAGQ